MGEAKAKRRAAPGEVAFVRRAIAKHGMDYGAITRDITKSCNYLQWTEPQVRRKVDRVVALGARRRPRRRAQSNSPRVSSHCLLNHSHLGTSLRCDMRHVCVDVAMRLRMNDAHSAVTWPAAHSGANVPLFHQRNRRSTAELARVRCGAT